MCLIEYFQPQYETREIKDEARIKRTITGILVNDNGLVLTSDLIYPANLDIVARNQFFSGMMPPENISVSFIPEKKLKAKLIGKDEQLRLAFVQIIEKENLPDAVKFKDRDNYRLGESLFLIQHLNGRWDHEVIFSQSFINAKIKKPQEKLLSTREIPALSPGGLVVDVQGNPIGVVHRGNHVFPVFDYELEEPGNGQNVIEILPAKDFMKLIENPPKLISQKKGSGKSWLGIQMQILKRDMAEYWDLEGTWGIVVNSVVRGSPAEKAGLEIGDIITSIGELQIPGEDRKNLDVFRNYVRNLPEGDVNLRLIRNQEPLSLKVQLKSAPISQYLAEEVGEEDLGFTVKELTQDIIINNDLKFETEGVWVSRVEEAGPVSLGGLSVDDLILSINDSKIGNLATFGEKIQEIKQEKPEYIQIFIQRDGKTQYIFVKTEWD
jgi:serine protease Do